MQRIRFCYHVSNKSNLFFLGDSIIRIGLVLFVIIFFTYYNILQPVYITDSAIKELRNMFYFLYKLQASIFIVQNRQKKSLHLTNRNSAYRECTDCLSTCACTFAVATGAGAGVATSAFIHIILRDTKNWLPRSGSRCVGMKQFYTF